MTDTRLKTETETYNKRLPEWSDKQGKYVVICKEDVIGIYGDYEDALKVGYDKCGVEPFLVKKIEEIETIHFLSREVQDTCPT